MLNRRCAPGAARPTIFFLGGGGGRGLFCYSPLSAAALELRRSSNFQISKPSGVWDINHIFLFHISQFESNSILSSPFPFRLYFASAGNHSTLSYFIFFFFCNYITFLHLVDGCHTHAQAHRWSSCSSIYVLPYPSPPLASHSRAGLKRH